MTYRSFAIDPGITTTGWSVMEDGHVWVDAGLLMPKPRKGDSGLRLASLCDQLFRLLEDWKPVDVVVEWTSGHVNVGRHRGSGAGLSIYGMAVGALWRECEWWAKSHAHGQCYPRVHRVEENTWTARRPKIKSGRGAMAISRVDVCRGLFPQYDPEKDPGGDMADALLLNCWFQGVRKLQALEAMQYQPPGV